MLAAIAAAASANGAGELAQLSVAEAQAIEPALHCAGALLSPATGIIDSHALMLALLGDAEQGGAALSLFTQVVSGRIEPGRIVLKTRDVTSREDFEIVARHVVNAAGLGAVALAGSIAGLDEKFVPRLYYAKGNYFSMAARALFRGSLSVRSGRCRCHSPRLRMPVWSRRRGGRTKWYRSILASRRFYAESANTGGPLAGSLQRAIAASVPAGGQASPAGLVLQDGSSRGGQSHQRFGIEAPA